MSVSNTLESFWGVDTWETPISRFAWHVFQGVQEDRPDFKWEDQKLEHTYKFLPRRYEEWQERRSQLIEKWHGLPRSTPIHQVLSIHFPVQLERIDLSKDPPHLKDMEFMYYLPPSLLNDKQVAKVIFWELLTLCSWIRRLAFYSAVKRYSEQKADPSSLETYCTQRALETTQEAFKTGTIASLFKTYIKLDTDLTDRDKEKAGVKSHRLPCILADITITASWYPVSPTFPIACCLARACTAIMEAYHLDRNAPADVSPIPLIPSITLSDVLEVRPLPNADKIDNVVKGAIAPVAALYRTTASMLMDRKKEDAGESAKEEFAHSWLDISREIPTKFRILKETSNEEYWSRMAKFLSSWMERFKQAIKYVVENSGIMRIDLKKGKASVLVAVKELSQSTQFRKSMMLKDMFEGYTRISVLAAQAVACALTEFEQDVKSFCSVEPRAASVASSDSAEVSTESNIRREDLFDRLETKRTQLGRTVIERVTADIAKRAAELKEQAAQVFARESKETQDRIDRVNRIIEDHNTSIQVRQDQKDQVSLMLSESLEVLRKVDFLVVGKAADAWMKHWTSCFVPVWPQPKYGGMPWKFTVMRISTEDSFLDELLLQRMPHLKYLSNDRSPCCLPAEFDACINQIEQCKMLTSETIGSEGPRFFPARFSDLVLFWLGQLHKNCNRADSWYKPIL